MQCTKCDTSVWDGVNGETVGGRAYCYAHLTGTLKHQPDMDVAQNLLPIVGGYAVKRSDFVRRKINPNPVRRNAHSLAKEIVSMVGISSSKITVGRVRDRITALDVRRVTPETFRLEFCGLLTGLGITPTQEQLDQMFRMVYRPQIATRFNSTAELTRSIGLLLGLSDQKEDQPKFGRIRHFVVHAKCVESHSFKDDFRDLLKSLGLSPTGEDMRLVCGMVVEFRKRTGVNRRDYHVGLDSSAQMQEEDPVESTLDFSEVPSLWIPEKSMRLPNMLVAIATAARIDPRALVEMVEPDTSPEEPGVIFITAVNAAEAEAHGLLVGCRDRVRRTGPIEVTIH